ncbi:MAG: DUF1570 domain-containing protein [Planctomycetaceae bacterium]|nr:DUF1570 domain-containing protein [Planctomycetaceae bacterium]
MLWWPIDWIRQPAGAAGAKPSRLAMPAPTPPPAKDLQEVAELGRELGLGSAYDSKRNFVLLTPGASGWAGLTTSVLDNVHDRFCQSFLQAGFTLRPPAGALTWICFSTRADFDRYARMADHSDLWWSRGYYSTRTNRVAIFRCGDAQQGKDLTELAHEAAHQLAYNTGLQKRGVMYPVWISEGIATNLETVLISPSPLTTTNARRAQALRNGRFIPLAELTAWTSVPVENEQATENAYAHIWGLFHFLINRKPAELQKYMAALSLMPAGRRGGMQLQQEFLRSFGPFSVVDAQFRQYVTALGMENSIASGPSQ